MGWDTKSLLSPKYLLIIPQRPKATPKGYLGSNLSTVLCKKYPDFIDKFLKKKL
jgi:hypothetical protein